MDDPEREYHEQVINRAAALVAQADPGWQPDEQEAERWKTATTVIAAQIDAVRLAERQQLAPDDYQDLIAHAYKLGKQIDEEWFITGTASQGGFVFFGEQARWASVLRALWDLDEILLLRRGDDLASSPYAYSHGS